MDSKLDDSNLDLFADVLTITLSMLMLVAVILAMNSTVGDGNLSLLDDPSLVSSLKALQVDEAKRTVDRLKSDLVTKTGWDERRLRKEVLRRIDERGDVLRAAREDALSELQLDLRGLQREMLDTIKLDVVEYAVHQELSSNYGRRYAVDTKIKAAQEVNLNHLRHRDEGRSGKPLYIVFSGGRAYPLFRFVGDRIVRNQEGVSWENLEGELRSVVRFSPSGGISSDGFSEYAAHVARALPSFRGREVSVISYADSLLDSRAFLLALRKYGVRGGWEPKENDIPLVVSVDGLLQDE